MKIDVKNIEDICIFLLSGRIDATNYIEIEDCFNDYYKQFKKFIIDFDNVEFIDSTGLGAIVNILRILNENGGGLKLINLKNKVKMVFSITQAIKFFDTYYSIEEAVNAFKKV